MAETIPDDPTGERWVVILVHGVGEMKPADMIDSVAPVVSAVGDPLRKPSDLYELARLPEEDATPFPVFMRRDRIGAAAVVFAEVFWADLSRIRGDALALVPGMFHLLFGVRLIAFQASAQPGAQARALQLLLKAVAFLARGPMLALYLFATSYALIYLIGEGLRVYGWGVDFRTAPAAPVLFGVLGAAAVVVGLVAAWLSRRSHFFTATPWTSLAVVGLLAALLAAAVAYRWEASPDALLAAVQHEYPIIGGADWTEFYLAVPLLAAHAALWAAAAFLLASWLPLMLARRLRDPALRPGLSVAYMAAALQTLLWVLVLAPLDFVCVWAITLKPTLSEAGPYWNALYQYVLFLTGLLLAVAAAAGGLWVYRGRWARRGGPAERPAGVAPRLIVGAVIEWTLLAASALFLVVILVLPFTGRLDWRLPGLAAALVVWLLAAAAVAVGLLAPGPLRNIAHVAMDVINHFRVKGKRYPVRDRIDRRFRSVLQFILGRERPTHLLVVAHSQGTVIALDAFRDSACRAALDQAGLRPERVALATFGSPYTHLYQYYFPVQYPPLPGRDLLGPRVGRWSNVFRVDDYVGMEVDGREDRDRPLNHALDAGGHTNYWRPEVFRVIADLLPGGPPAATPPAGR